jgi:hypothetical protein
MAIYAFASFSFAAVTCAPAVTALSTDVEI